MMSPELKVLYTIFFVIVALSVVVGTLAVLP
jgi:hypothetical protein